MRLVSHLFILYMLLSFVSHNSANASDGINQNTKTDSAPVTQNTDATSDGGNDTSGSNYCADSLDTLQIKHGQISTSIKGEVLVDHVIEYVCDSGYELIGAKSITCLDSGKFSDSAPFCEPVACPAIDPEANSRASSYAGSFGERVSFMCDEGYSFVDRESSVRRINITCEADGEWSDVEPMCEKITCALPKEVPEHLEVNSTFAFFGDVISFACASGYTLVGSKTSTCVGSFVFPSGPPSCVREGVMCPSIDFKSLGNAEASQESARVGERIFIRCERGNVVAGSGVSSVAIDCLDSGNYSDPLPFCEPCKGQ